MEGEKQQHKDGQDAIDIKLQHLLGHFRKEFEGELSAEKLGSKFGGYGSFLPTYLRFPSTVLQSKTLSIMQNKRSKKLPNEHIQLVATSLGGVLSTKVSSTSLATDVAKIGEMDVIVVRSNREISPLRNDSIDKNIHICDEKRVELPMKMGSGTVTCKFSPENESFLAPSPMSIIQIMTSHQIPEGSLLSPLPNFKLPLLETNEKVFAKESEKLTVKTEFQKDPSKNRNDIELVKERLKSCKWISTEYKRRYIDRTKGCPLETKEESKENIHMFVIKKKWIKCSVCEKLRLLPVGVEPSSLSKKWLCQMLYWLPGMNRCDISEESTTQAVNGMFGIQLGQCQVDANKAQLQHPDSMNHSRLVIKKNKQSSLKSKSSTGVVQKPIEEVQDGTGILYQVIKGNGAVMAMDKFKQQEQWKLKQNVSNREGNAGQGKRKNEVEVGVHKLLKKTKARVAFDGSNGELLRFPGESSKVDNLHETPICSVKPLVKSKSSTNVVQQLQKSFQASTCILHQEIKGNGVSMKIPKYKKEEKWKLKNIASNRAEGNVGQGKRKYEVEEGVYKPLQKTKPRVAIDGFNGELSTLLKESSKVDNLYETLICSEGRDPLKAVVSSSVRREHGKDIGNTILKEARDLKQKADRLKAMGDSEHDIMGYYFESALKFLHSASLLEDCNAENTEHGEISLSINLYTDSARLFEFCGSTYETIKEMEAAALAYKCMEVAHMRIVLSKTFCLTKDRRQLHATFQNAPHGKSPTLSSPYVDNFNNHAMMDEICVNPARVDGSPHLAGSHIVAAQHRPHFLRVLQYTQDVIAGMGAFKKSESAFSAAVVNMPEGNIGTEKISEVKRVIDFSFHDIDGLIRLVRIALEAIYH